MTFVVVSGLPGAGKSQIAGPLARELGLPLFAKDPIKETLWDCLAGPNDLDWSRLLGRAANEVVVSVAAANRGGVLDSFLASRMGRRFPRCSPRADRRGVLRVPARRGAPAV